MMGEVLSCLTIPNEYLEYHAAHFAMFGKKINKQNIDD